MKRTNNLHKHCKEQLLLLVKESNPHRTAKELELFSTMADDPQNNSTRNLPIHLSDEEFAYWYAYKNNPNDLERLIQSFKVKSMPAYYEPKIEKYKMLMKMTKKVFAEINRFKKDNRPEYDTSAKLVVKKLNNQTRWLIDLALSGDELKKLLAIDSMCPRGLEIIGAKRNAYGKAEAAFVGYKPSSFKNPIHYYFESENVEKIREMLIEKYGEDEFKLRMRFVENPFEAGFRISYPRYPSNWNTQFSVWYHIIDNRNFEKIYVQLNESDREKLTQFVFGDDDSLQIKDSPYYITDSWMQEKIQKYGANAPLTIVSDADVKSALNKLALGKTLADPSNPLIDEIRKLTA